MDPELLKVIGFFAFFFIIVPWSFMLMFAVAKKLGLDV